MPTTQEFFSGTHGNGLNFCPSRMSVDGYDRWITASGHKKGDGVPTAASISMSLMQCARLFWHLYSVSGYTVTSDGSGFVDPPSYNGAQSAEGVYIIANNTSVVGGFSSEAGEEIEPYERVCKSSVAGGETGLRDNSDIVCHASGSVSIAALYDGGVLMGYGFYYTDEFFRARAHFKNSGECESRVSLRSYIFSEQSDTAFRVYDYAYVEIDGFHFLCEAFAAGFGNNFFVFANATALTASAALTAEDWGDDGEITAESSVDCSGLIFNFWTPL